MSELLRKYENEILENLENHACLYKTIGSSGKFGGVDETPRYYNISEYNEDKNVLEIRSTQNSSLGFDIYIEEEDRQDKYFWIKVRNENNKNWEWFKKLRTNYLIDYHPTIDAGYDRFEEFEYSLDPRKTAEYLESKVEVKEITEVLQEMFTENTGKHMLDSGGDNGRQWQRNQTRDFEKEPTAEIEYYDGKFSHVNVNTYHYLKEVLEVDEVCEVVNNILRENELHWVTEVDLDLIQEVYREAEYKGNQWNTYNGEYNCDHVFQGRFLMINDEPYVLFQLHLGADVRGGYSNVQCFKVEKFLSGWVEHTLYNNSEDFNIDIRYPSEMVKYNHVDYSEEYVDNDELEEIVKEDSGWDIELMISEETCIY